VIYTHLFPLIGELTTDPRLCRLIFFLGYELTSFYLLLDQVALFIKGQFDFDGAEALFTSDERFPTKVGGLFF
jgi:hypothetical protein